MSFDELLDVIESEGFCYTFIEYSDFDEIEDEKFHKLRKRFVEAHQDLLDYIYKNIDE